MDANVRNVYRLRAMKTMESLTRNNFEAHYVENSADAVKLVASLCPKGSSVSTGGSATLNESGVYALLTGGDYRFIDRFAPDGAADEKTREIFTCDAFFTSSNALTEDGKLYNIDGTGNRVAALTYGPKTVFVIVGVNKIVPDVEAAKTRLETMASPANAMRLNKKTPCAVNGECADCHSPDRICCTTVITSYQRRKGRVKVIIVGEELGF